MVKTQKNIQKIGRLEEAAVLGEKEYIYFLSFSKKYWNNGRSQAKKFTRPGKNSGNVGRMEEALEEENNLKL